MPQRPRPRLSLLTALALALPAATGCDANPEAPTAPKPGDPAANLKRGYPYGSWAFLAP